MVSRSARCGRSEVVCCVWQFLNRACIECADCVCRAGRVRVPLARGQLRRPVKDCSRHKAFKISAIDGSADPITVTRHGGCGAAWR